MFFLKLYIYLLITRISTVNASITYIRLATPHQIDEPTSIIHRTDSRLLPVTIK